MVLHAEGVVYGEPGKGVFIKDHTYTAGTRDGRYVSDYERRQPDQPRARNRASTAYSKRRVLRGTGPERR